MQTHPQGFDPIVWFKRNYLVVIIVFLSLYLLLAFLAPVMQKLEFPTISATLYRAYSTLCHQYAYRSWFLFGEQAYYPLEGQDGMKSVYEALQIPIGNPESTREMIGNATAGYKVAICQRDVSLYSALLLFALIFLISKKHIQPLHLSLWLLLAVLPIGVDGLLQMAGSYHLFSVTYESTPLMRSITGVMFGFFSGWLLFPSIHKTIEKEKQEYADPS